MAGERKEQKRSGVRGQVSGAGGRAKPETEAKPKAKQNAAPRAENEGKPEAAKKPAREKRERKPARRRRREPAEREAPRPAPARPVVRAQAKYVRSSARKARLVIEHIRGKSLGEARAVLRHSTRAVARDLERLLDSAAANAENNHELVADDLYVEDVYADEGPTIRRWRPRAMGRATRIRKRTSHLTVTLTPKE